MFTISPANTQEKYLCDQAYETGTPISGTFELTPLCNMDCRMCYVRTTPAAMKQQGRMLELGQWLRIGKEAAESGCLFLLLTGGECLLYPEFASLYRGLRAMGIIITLNTNGTLITPEVIALLRNERPRRVNVSLYGASNDTYACLCRHPKGFTETMNGIKRLLDADIPVKVNFTATPQNVHDLEAVIRITEEMEIPISTPTYIFPPVRKPHECRQQAVHRLSPEEAARYQFDIICRAHAKDPDFREHLHTVLRDMAPAQPHTVVVDPPAGFLCTAGRSSFWIDWKGALSACGIMSCPSVDLTEQHFSQAWKTLSETNKKIVTSKECFNCRFRPVCKGCAASSMAENGNTAEPPRYHCRLSATYEQLIKEYLQQPENKNTEKHFI